MRERKKERPRVRYESKKRDEGESDEESLICLIVEGMMIIKNQKEKEYECVI